MHRMILVIVATFTAAAQTQVDLRTQGKNVDFTTASSTRPVKTGTTLPATCTAGDLYFKTNAPSGMNLYGCPSTNTWALQSGGSGGGGGGPVTIESNGTTIGARGTVNFISGAGVLSTISDTGAQIDIQQGVDTSTILSKTTAQSGATLLCSSASGSASAYSCALTPTLQAYTTGMVLRWRPDVSGAGGAATLNVDTLGAVPLKLADGATNPTTADLVAGRLYSLWYDGAVFRLLTPPVNVAASGAQPGCDTTQRGRIWQTLGAAGIKDTVAVCAKDASDAYAWRAIY
ncbi:MAG: hypothetical protein ACRD2O_02350 [Terriglobia bacterium]